MRPADEDVHGHAIAYHESGKEVFQKRAVTSQRELPNAKKPVRRESRVDSLAYESGLLHDHHANAADPDSDGIKSSRGQRLSTLKQQSNQNHVADDAEDGTDPNASAFQVPFHEHPIHGFCWTIFYAA